ICTIASTNIKNPKTVTSSTPTSIFSAPISTPSTPTSIPSTSIPSTPTSVSNSSTSIPKDSCCVSGGPGRNGSYTVDLTNIVPYNSALNLSSVEECCKSCYDEPRCATYYYSFNGAKSVCYHYDTSTMCGSQLFQAPLSYMAIGELGCGFCRT
ncbi:25597_t:CDS:1, partial [Racocetra persica]